MDRRDRVRQEGRWYKSLDTSKMMACISYYYEDDEGNDVEADVEVPVLFEVCGTCSGKGTHVNPSIDAHGITPEEFEEDPDFKESYFEGHYDVPCYECQGQRVVPVPDESQLSEEAKKALESQEEMRRIQTEEARYQRMESGGY